MGQLYKKKKIRLWQKNFSKNESILKENHLCKSRTRVSEYNAPKHVHGCTNGQRYHICHMGLSKCKMHRHRTFKLFERPNMITETIILHNNEH